VLEARAAGEAEFLAALLLGIREDPADPLVGKFRRAGVSHVLALSGMHLGIAEGFVLLLTKPVLGTRKAYMLTLPLLAAYIWIVGLKPSLLRAGIMYLLMIFRIVGTRRPDTLSLLAISLVLALEIDPDSISTLSFQLSYLALFGIVTIGTYAGRFISSYLPRALSLPLGMSLGAQIATAPIIAGHFGLLYPVGLFASILVSPLIAVYIWSGITFVVISFIDTLSGSPQITVLLSQSVFHVMDQIRRIITVAVTCFSRVPAVAIGSTAAWTIGGVFLCFIVSRRCIEYWHKGRGARLSERDRQNPYLQRPNGEEAVRTELPH
jgi:competence protein ComEC